MYEKNLKIGTTAIKALNSLKQDNTQNLSTRKILCQKKGKRESTQQLNIARILSLSNKGQGNIRQ